MDHAGTILFSLDCLALGEHRHRNMQVSVREDAQFSRKVFDSRPILPSFPRKESERLPCPTVKTNRGVLHLLQLLDELTGNRRIRPWEYTPRIYL